MTVAICPCCGQPVARGSVPASALLEASLTVSQHRIVEALVAAWPRHVTKEHLVDVLYGDDPNGGPEWATTNVNVFMLQLRKMLPAYGWTIPKAIGGPGRKGIYRLEPLQ